MSWTPHRGVPTFFTETPYNSSSFMPLKSFIDVPRDSHFPIQNLPFGVFKPRDGTARVGVAIGDFVVDLSILEELGHFLPAAAAVRSGTGGGSPPGTAATTTIPDHKLFSKDSLNDFLTLGRPAWQKTREILQHLLAADIPVLR